MNIVNLVGRLAKDPVARDRSDTRITELILVTERPVIRDGKVQKDPETGYPVMLPTSTGSKQAGYSQPRAGRRSARMV